MCKLFEIKYYVVLVEYTFALKPMITTEKYPPPRTLKALKYCEIKYST